MQLLNCLFVPSFSFPRPALLTLVPWVVVLFHLLILPLVFFQWTFCFLLLLYLLWTISPNKTISPAFVVVASLLYVRISLFCHIHSLKIIRDSVFRELRQFRHLFPFVVFYFRNVWIILYQTFSLLFFCPKFLNLCLSLFKPELVSSCNVVKTRWHLLKRFFIEVRLEGMLLLFFFCGLSF